MNGWVSRVKGTDKGFSRGTLCPPAPIPTRRSSAPQSPLVLGSRPRARSLCPWPGGTSLSFAPYGLAPAPSAGASQVALRRHRRFAGIVSGALISFASLLYAGGSAALDVQGHRGAGGLMPENSLPAFEKALALRVPTLELDLQMTKDRVVVVHHDSSLDGKRCVYDDGGAVPNTLIEQLNYDDLARIDCGRRTNPGFPLQRPVYRTRIPRLEQVLTLARHAGYPVRLSVELKWKKRKDEVSIEDFAERVVALVKQYGLERRTIIQSFHPSALKAVLRSDPSIARAILVRRPEDYDRLVAQSAATILSPRYDGLRGEDVARFQRQKIAVIPWTVNEIVDMCRMIAWAVDGFITDYPDRALRLLAEKGCASDRP